MDCQNLRETELINQLIEDSSTSVYVCDAKTYEMLYVNKKCAALCGKTVEEAIGTPCYTYLKGIDKPCDPCYMDSSNEETFSEREYSSPVSGRHYMTRGKFINWDGKKALVEYLIDETERINIQRNLRDLVDGIPGGIGIYNYYYDGRVEMVYVNNGYYNMIGSSRESREEYGGFSIFDAVYTDDIEVIKKEAFKAINENCTFNTELRLITGNGQYRWYKIQAKIAEKDSEKTVFYASYSDIDNEKKARLQLEASQRVLEFANKEGQTLIWLFDIDKREITDELKNSSILAFPKANKSVPECFIGNGMIMSEDEASFIEMYDLLYEGAERSECTVRVKNNVTNQYVWQHIVYSRLYDSYFEGRRAVGIASDVDIQQKNRINYEHEMQLRHELIKDAILYYEVNLSTGIIEEYKSKISDIPGMKASICMTDELYEKIKKNIADEDRVNVINNLSLKTLLNSYSEGKTSVEIIYRRKFSGIGMHWVKANVTIMKRPVSEEIIAFIYVRDIDEEKKNQLAMNSIIDEEIESISVVNVDTGLSKVVKAHTEIMKIFPDKWNDHDERIKKISNAFIIPEERLMCCELFFLNNMVEQLQKKASISHVFRTKNGHNPEKRKRILAYYLDDNRDTIVISFRDVTGLYEEEERQKRELQNAVDTANKANNAKSEFLSRMSHNMRTPMNAVIGLVNLAKEEKEITKINEYLNNIDISSHFLLGLINDILDLGKIENGIIDLEETLYSLEDFKRNINNVIRPLMNEKEIDFIFEPYCGIEKIYTDKLRFNQIFFILLSNAAKYTQKGGCVELIAEHIPNKQDKYGMRFHIRDNGVGMSESFQKVLFEPFSHERLQSAETQGTGLGLAIVQKLVHIMGGNLDVKSKLGEGTEFIIDLYNKTENDTKKTENCITENNVCLNGIKILLVEDNEINVMVAQTMLENKNCLVDIAADGQEAIDIFSKSNEKYYDVILMDIRMPVLDGISATKKIRELPRIDAAKIPIIAMTADAFPEEKKKTLEAGMNSHITKPIEPNILYTEILRCLQMSTAL